MSLSPLPLPNLFLFSLRSPSVQNLQAEALIQIPKAIQIPFTNSKRKQTEQSTINTPAKHTKQNQKDATKHFTQPPQLKNSPPPRLPTLPKPPSKSLRPPNASTFPLKRRRVYRQTPKHSNPNAKEFQIKRKDVFQPHFPSQTPPHTPVSRKHI